MNNRGQTSVNNRGQTTVNLSSKVAPVALGQLAGPGLGITVVCSLFFILALPWLLAMGRPQSEEFGF
jgi:hypothetical protein